MYRYQNGVDALHSETVSILIESLSKILNTANVYTRKGLEHIANYNDKLWNIYRIFLVLRYYQVTISDKHNRSMCFILNIFEVIVSFVHILSKISNCAILNAPLSAQRCSALKISSGTISSQPT